MVKDVFPRQFFCDKCQKCTQSASFSAFSKADEEVEAFCGGIIRKPKNPKNDHEKWNRIRLCLLNDGENPRRGINTLDFTEQEAAEIIRILSRCLGDSLERLQPPRNKK